MLSRRDIREKLLNTGRFDLSTPEDLRKLDKMVLGAHAWLSSPEVMTLEDGDAAKLGPRQLLESIKWMGSSTPEKVVNDILRAMNSRGCVKLLGTKAMRAALAFSKQYCYQNCCPPVFVTGYELMNDNDIVRPAKTVLIVTMSADGETGRIFPEARAKMAEKINVEAGPSFLILEDRYHGVLCEFLESLLRPRVVLTARER